MTNTRGFVERSRFLIILGLVVVVGLIIAFTKDSGDDGGSADDPPTSGITTPATTPTSDSGPQFDGHGADVDQAMFGDSWPLTIDSGRVNCIKVADNRVQVVFTTDDNKRYAINGTARAMAADFGYLDVRPIWADDPTNPGAKIDISPLIDICAPLM